MSLIQLTMVSVTPGYLIGCGSVRPAVLWSGTSLWSSQLWSAFLRSEGSHGGSLGFNRLSTHCLSTSRPVCVVRGESAVLAPPSAAMQGVSAQLNLPINRPVLCVCVFFKKNNEYLLPESVDLECVKYCVVYDNNTSTLEVLLKDDDDDSDSDSAGKGGFYATAARIIVNGY